MIYNSVAEIYEANDSARARLFESVEGLDDGQQSFRPEPGLWSVAEILEHLSLVEAQLVRLFQVVLRKAEAAGGAGRAVDAPFAPITLREVAERAATEKYKAPETAVPTGGVTLTDSIARLNQTRDALNELRPLIERLDCTQMLYPHPAFGPLNLYQWLAFMGLHQSRHRRQIEALRETMNAAPTD